MKINEELYPLTVIADRYNGCYSGGKFTAWPLDYDEMPIEPVSGDTDCEIFWSEYDGIVGLGETVQEAIDDLVAKRNNINSTPKKPASEDLEEELNRWRHEHFHGRRDKEADGEYLERLSQLDIARHFADWQLQNMKEPLRMEYEKGRYDMREEMMKDAVEGYVLEKEGYLLIGFPVNPTCIKYGDHVNLIIIKEDRI